MTPSPEIYFMYKISIDLHRYGIVHEECGFISRGQKLEYAFGAAVCEIQARKHIAYIECTATPRSHACPLEIGYVIDMWKPSVA